MIPGFTTAFTFGGKTDPTGTPDWMKKWYSPERQQQQQQRNQATGTQPSWLEKIQQQAAQVINKTPWIKAIGQGVNTMAGAATKYLPAAMQGNTMWSNYQGGKELMESINYPRQNPFAPPQQQQQKIIPYGSYFNTGGPQGPPDSMRPPTITDPMALRMQALATLNNYLAFRNYDPNKPMEAEDAMWQALKNAGLDTAMGQRRLQQMAGPNWQRALLRSLTPITQPQQPAPVYTGGGGYSPYPRYGGGGGGGGGYSPYVPRPYTPTPQSTPAWAQGLVNWRIK